MNPPNQSTPPPTASPVLPLIVRNAIRREAGKEGISEAEMTRSLLHGADLPGCPQEDRTAAPPVTEAATAADADGRVQVLLIIQPERMTPEEVGRLAQTVFQPEPGGNDFIRKLIDAKSPPRRDGEGGGSEWSDPAPAVNFGSCLTGAELAEFNARCWLHGKPPGDVLASLIKREIANETKAGTVPPAP